MEALLVTFFFLSPDGLRLAAEVLLYILDDWLRDDMGRSRPKDSCWLVGDKAEAPFTDLDLVEQDFLQKKLEHKIKV